MRNYLWILLSASLVTALFFSPVVRAANGITLSPPLSDVVLGPGLIETSVDLTLTNNTEQLSRVTLKLVDLKALGEFGGTSLDQAGLSDNYGLANWMSLPGGDTAVIQAGQTIKVKVTITNRSDLTPGGHYGAVIVTNDPGESVRSELSISQQLVSLIFVKKLGGENYGLSLDVLQSDQTKNRLPQSIKLTFKNTGNVHVTPRGYIEITDPKGRVVSKALINEDSSLVLPGSSRQYTSLVQPISDSRMPGKYKVTAFYRFDGQDSFMTKEVYITRSGLTPQMWMGLGFVGLIGSLAAVFGFRRNIHHRK